MSAIVFILTATNILMFGLCLGVIGRTRRSSHDVSARLDASAALEQAQNNWHSIGKIEEALIARGVLTQDELLEVRSS